MISPTVLFCVSIMLLTHNCNSTTPVKKCSGDLPFPLKVKIDDCEKLPCNVFKGTTSQMLVHFVAVKDETHYIETDISVSVLGMKIPYELPSENGKVCNNLMFGAKCPLYAEEDVFFNLSFPISSNLLETSIKTEVKLRDSERDVVACFVTHMKVIR